jgi:hypothetical protein
MSKSRLPEYSNVESEWTTGNQDCWFESVIDREYPAQRLVFNEVFRNGSLQATAVLKEFDTMDAGAEHKEAAIVFRYKDPLNLYFAGIGNFNSRFFITRLIEGQVAPLATFASKGSLQVDRPYRIEVRCDGSRIRLLHNGINHLSARDETFDFGKWGLSTFRTRARFDMVRRFLTKPKCFVIMPFADELNAIYQVIKEVVEACGMNCERADERFLSGSIIDDVKVQIEESDLIIADFTGKNANVFYEAGYVDALGKPLISIAQDIGELPFDVRHLRTLTYSTRILSDRKLKDGLSKAIRAMTGLTAEPT